MKLIKIILLLLILMTSVNHDACSFAPGFKKFTPLPNIKENTAKPNKPVIKNLTIKRGYDDGNGGSCSDAGVISIMFERINPIQQTGYKFRIISGSFSDNVFPTEIVMPTQFNVAENKLFFVWLDGAKNIQEPLSFDLEIIAISPEFNESEPRILKIRHAGGESN